jgi:acyl dehydratase
MTLYFDDLALGQIFTAGPITMERDRIVSFATEFDPQPMHIDEVAASASPLGGLIASGWHTAAVTMRLLIDGACPRLANGAVGAGVEALTWPLPVRPGDVLSAQSEIVELRPSRSRPDRGLMKLRTITTRQDGATVLTVTATIMVPRNLSTEATLPG